MLSVFSYRKNNVIFADRLYLEVQILWKTL